MSAILLTTFNARYTHASFALRCLRANLGPWRAQSALLEFDLRKPVATAVDEWLAHAPRVIGIAVYIWNLERVREAVGLLRARDPGVLVVLGGPEIGDAPAGEPLLALADTVVAGEGEHAFRELCGAWLERGERPPRRIEAAPPAPATLASPYAEYTDADLRHRILYVETARGCGCACAYCTSAVAPGVRAFALERVLADFDRLWRRGARRFKLLDRSFNADPVRAGAVLDFFLARAEPGMQVHLEMLPDRSTPALLERMARFPAGALHLEVGVQTLDPAVAARIGRRQAMARTLEHLRLFHDMGADVHADLIIGLPGETLAGFAHGVDRLAATRPATIQLNPLKRLWGTPLAARAEAWGLVFDPRPPYDVRVTPDLDAATLAELARLARFWELVRNHGRFPRVVALLEREGGAFAGFRRLSADLWRRFGRAHGLALNALAGALCAHLIETVGTAPAEARAAVTADYSADRRRRMTDLQL